jgi:hypothetical protein
MVIRQEKYQQLVEQHVSKNTLFCVGAIKSEDWWLFTMEYTTGKDACGEMYFCGQFQGGCGKWVAFAFFHKKSGKCKICRNQKKVDQDAGLGKIMNL